MENRDRDKDLDSSKSSSSSGDLDSTWENEPSRKDSGGLQGDQGRSGGDIESDGGSDRESPRSGGREMEH
jgi:hypothetical protein